MHRLRIFGGLLDLFAPDFETLFDGELNSADALEIATIVPAGRAGKGIHGALTNALEKFRKTRNANKRTHDRVNFNLNRLPDDMQTAVNDTFAHINKGTKPDYANRNRGKPFANRDRHLPTKDGSGNRISYTEYNVKNVRTDEATKYGRDRIVMGSDGRAYYSGTHYGDRGGSPFGRIK